MPPKATMKWDAEADAKLFGLFLNLFDIKISKPMMGKLNEAMGLEPKSQAIAHRIGSARKRAAADLSNAGTTPMKTIPLTPRGPKTTAGGTPRSRGSTRSKKSAASKAESDNDDGLTSDENIDSPTTVTRAKSARASVKRSYKESDTDGDDEEDVSDFGQDKSTPKKAKIMDIKTEAKDDSAEDSGQAEPTDQEVPQSKSYFDGDGGLSEPDEV